MVLWSGVLGSGGVGMDWGCWHGLGAAYPTPDLAINVLLVEL